ncbi:MAG: serine/threonine-protein kinase [Bacteroidota bacterium]
MTPDRWQAIESIFDEAADLASADRSAFLDAACRQPDGAPDVGLREEVERLLALDAGAETFFGQLREDLGPTAASPRPVPEAGPWRLVERVGEGGMGEVWRAERSDGSYAQTAAVKLVRPGLGADLLARFRAERHVLARLSHPSIARLLDGGTASDGRPYLALEYVDGEPITAYADRRRLSINERLELFQDVCAAVAAAHRQLVVHRDLKPSNVLVTDRGEVKLLDFGIAKLLDEDAEFTVAVTGADRRVMTPEYAAPEQVRGEPATTATDVYGLGVLLYELLTGTRPYRVESRVRRAIEQAILETEPTDPSTAVTGATEAAAARATEPVKLKRRLRGDIDQIVLKALRKDPERRYEGAAALSADLGRHLDGLPVEARPESARYRIGRFVRRHRVGVAAAVVALLAILGGSGAALWQGAEAARQRDRAEAEARTSEEVTAFVTSLFEEANPNEAGGDTLTVFDALARGADRARDELADEPGVRAAVLTTIGTVYREMGQLDEADTLLAEAVAIPGVGPVRRARALEELGTLRLNQAEYAAGDSLFRESLDLRVEALGPEHVEVASAYTALGVAQRYLGDYPEAEQFYRQSLQIRDAVQQTETSDYATTLSGLGVALSRQTKLDEAETITRRALGLQRQLAGDTSLSVAIAYNNLGALLHNQGDYAGAEAIYLQAIGRWRHILGEDHPNVAIGLSNMGAMYVMAEDYDKARSYYQESLALFTSRYHPDHPEVAFTLASISSLERLVGNGEEAERLARQALASFATSLEPDHPYIGNAEHELARALRVQNDPEAEERFRRALSIYESTVSPDNPRVYGAQIELAAVLADQGSVDEARQRVEAALVHSEAAEDSTWIARGREVLSRL